MLGLGVICHLGEAVVGVATCNPVLIGDGLLGASKSYAVGELMSPITEPIKDFVGNACSEVSWTEVIDSSPTW